jgi:mRNA-binding protein PUF3
MTDGIHNDFSSSSNPNSLAEKMNSSQSASDKAILDQLDADIGSIISSLSGNSITNSHNGTGLSAATFHNNTFDQPGDLLDNSRRNSASNNGSDVENDYGPFGIRRTTLSLGALNQNQAQANNRLIGSASVNVSLNHRSTTGGSGRFLEKFSAVAEATREVELLGGGLGSLSIGSKSGRVPSSRRTSFLTGETSGAAKPFLESSPASLNENLNGSISGKQSISDRIDNYLSNSSSPVQHFNNPATSTTPQDKSRAMSVSSDITKSESNSTIVDQNENESATSNIWNSTNAAKSTPFIPSGAVRADNFQYQQMPPQMAMSPPQGYPPQMFPYGMPFNQSPYPMMPMMPPQFQGFPGGQPPLGEYNEVVDPNEGANENSSNPQIIPVQPQQPQPNFKGNSPPFIYPQAFSPYGYISHQLNGDSSQQPLQYNGPSPHNHNNNNNGGGNGSRRPNNGGPNGKRNGRSPKPTSPFGRGPGKNGPKNQIYRSPLLEEFRNNTTKEYKLKDIFGNAIEFSKDQHGSRFIQQQLEHSSTEEREVIFNEIREVATSLMTDVFGNYVIQKYFEFGTDTQRGVLLSEMKGNIKSLSMQMYGCRVVQKAIEFVKDDDQVSIVLELQDSVLNCIKDQNGNHVIQKAIEKIPIDKIDFILKSLEAQIYHLSTHPYGCRVIQRLLEYSNEEDQTFILSELNKFTYFLIQDQYGNYVIQHIIEFGRLQDKEVIFNTVSGSVVEFSKHKFASNVVEKTVVFGTDSQRASILEEVLVNNDKDDDSLVDDKSALGLMMKDQFANYVVQKLVDVSKGEKRKILIKKIRQYLNQISKSSYGKHFASIEKLLQLSETALASDD